MKTLRLLTVILIVGLISGLQAVQAKSKQYTTVNAPCAGSLPGQGTWPVGINQKGDIVGGCQDITGRVFHGFLLHQGKYTTLTAPKGGANLDAVRGPQTSTRKAMLSASTRTATVRPTGSCGTRA